MTLRRLASTPLLWRTPQQAALALSRSFADDADSHDDFKAKRKAQPASGQGLNEMIKKDVTENRVFVYMKGNPQQPMCGFSGNTIKILNAYGAKYGSRDVLQDPALREGIKAFTQWPTIPQVFINGEFVGGFDILYGMHQSGDLEKALTAAGALEGGK